jgi:hypothetical protein
VELKQDGGHRFSRAEVAILTLVARSAPDAAVEKHFEILVAAARDLQQELRAIRRELIAISVWSRAAVTNSTMLMCARDGSNPKEFLEEINALVDQALRAVGEDGLS